MDAVDYAVFKQNMPSSVLVILKFVDSMGAQSKLQFLRERPSFRNEDSGILY